MSVLTDNEPHSKMVKMTIFVKYILPQAKIGKKKKIYFCLPPPYYS
jgi:hypothetical protein